MKLAEKHNQEHTGHLESRIADAIASCDRHKTTVAELTNVLAAARQTLEVPEKQKHERVELLETERNDAIASLEREKATTASMTAELGKGSQSLSTCRKQREDSDCAREKDSGRLNKLQMDLAVMKKSRDTLSDTNTKLEQGKKALQALENTVKHELEQEQSKSRRLRETLKETKKDLGAREDLAKQRTLTWKVEAQVEFLLCQLDRSSTSIRRQRAFARVRDKIAISREKSKRQARA